jgi:hypothetical protein
MKQTKDQVAQPGVAPTEGQRLGASGAVGRQPLAANLGNGVGFVLSGPLQRFVVLLQPPVEAGRIHLGAKVQPGLLFWGGVLQPALLLIGRHIGQHLARDDPPDLAPQDG